MNNSNTSVTASATADVYLDAVEAMVNGATLATESLPNEIDDIAEPIDLLIRAVGALREVVLRQQQEIERLAARAQE